MDIKQLQNFYQDIDKEDLYTRYIYKLSELHEREQNYTEAGFTLLLHGDKLKWSEDILLAEGKYPEQMESERKEQLYMNAIGFFNEGKTWECGIRLCKELSELYEKELFDYHKLAAILETEARFFRNIITELRIVEPEYFRVSYYGNGFPYFLRNKTCIHRGKPYQKLGSFISMLTNEFPNAQILTHNKPVDDDIKNSTGMYLQLCRVQPMEEPKDVFKGKNVDINILKYYKVNDVRRFKFDRPFHKGTKDPQNEFATLWFERTTMTTSDSFPGVIDWFEVTESKTVELAPLEVAIETVETKNSEISSLIDEFTTTSSTKDINPLSMLLNGVIDAAVCGGTVQYKKLFLTARYQKDNPNDAELVVKLKTCLEEQTTLCRKGLDIHGKRITSSLQGLHQKLEEMYKTMCNDGLTADQAELRRKSASMRRPLPDTPLQKAISDKSSTLAAPINRSSRAMSQMVTPDRSRLSSGTLPPKSPSVSGIFESKQVFSPALPEEVCSLSGEAHDGIYEVTHQLDAEDYEFVDPVKMRESQLIQDDIYQVPTTLNTSSSNEDVYSFDKLDPQQPKMMSPTQNQNKKLPGTPVHPPPDNDIYTFDQLGPAPQVPKKVNNSSNVKEDLHHIQFTKKQPKPSDDIYSFDRLDTNRLQNPRSHKSPYDQLPLGTPKSKSPTPPADPQEDYIEPLDEEVLKNFKADDDYHRLSSVTVDQTYDRLQNADQPPPPMLPKKKKADSTSLNSPVKPPTNFTIGPEVLPNSYKHRESPMSPVKKNIPTTIANDDKDDVPPPLPTKRNSSFFDEAPNVSKNTPTKPTTATTTAAANNNDKTGEEVPPPLPTKRSSASFDDMPPMPLKQDAINKPKQSVRTKNPSPARNNSVAEEKPVGEKPIPKQRIGSISRPAAPPIPKKSSNQSVLAPIESAYSVLGPENNDTGPAASVYPPQLPIKQGSNNNKPRQPSPPPPIIPPKVPSIPSPVRPLPSIPTQLQQPLVPKPVLPPKNKPPTQSPSKPGSSGNRFK